MKFTAEIDHELTFADETHNPCRIRDAILIDGHVCDDVDAVTAFAHSHRIKVRQFDLEFGKEGSGKKSKAYSKTVIDELHHKHQYCPCRTLSSEEYAEECKCHDPG